MRRHLFRGVALIAALSIACPGPTFAQTPVPQQQANDASAFNTEQLDALLAPIALYPDNLLVQVLMASTYPLQVVDAARWREQPANSGLQGDALSRALEGQNWDPSVKSIVPFPQILAMLNGNLEWMQQLGYAFANQQSQVMDSVQRLRRQAQAAGSLKTTDQQRVVVEQQTVVIQPANPQLVYVPVYNPSVVYGSWPYPAYPPVYFPPPPGYVFAGAIATGLAFATGIAVAGSLWGWARPAWHGGYVNVNVNQYNRMNVNRAAINSNVWRPSAAGIAGRPALPPRGPVGGAARPMPLPANAIGRGNVQVQNNLVNRNTQIGNGNRAGNVARPSAPPGSGSVARPGGNPIGSTAPGARPGGTPIGSGTVGARPTPRAPQANRPNVARERPAGAFSGVNDGARANQFGARGAQSRAAQQALPTGGGARGQGGGARGLGGGARRR